MSGVWGVPKSLERLTKPEQGEDKRSADEVSVTRVRRIQTASATSCAYFVVARDNDVVVNGLRDEQLLDYGVQDIEFIRSRKGKNRSRI